MSNLLIITDVARLRKIFGRLTDDKGIRLRIVNNLEKGGEEITIEKPDVVFVQTHLSGLSADISLMHLKKQLGRKRSRFVLLAAPGQVNESVLKSFQGCLDTSLEDSRLLSELQLLLATLLGKPKKNIASPAPEPVTAADFQPQTVTAIKTSTLPDFQSVPVAAAVPPPQLIAGLQPHDIASTLPEPSLEEQGLTYAPHHRLQVYSEFTSSFDSAVSSTPNAAPLEQAAPTLVHEWDAENIASIEARPARSKRVTFMLWLAPVVVAVIILTYFQQRQLDTAPQQVLTKIIAPSVAKPTSLSPPPKPEPVKAPTVPQVTPPAVPPEQDRMSDKAVLSAIAENRGTKSPAAPATPDSRQKNLPDFIPRYGLDKQFGIANPGWERYRGQVTEFKILREAQAIKAIQVIDRGGNGVPESFMKGVLRQATKKPVLTIDTSEKKDGYEIQRGKIAHNISVVYYRDENSGKLRAFVLTWQ